MLLFVLWAAEHFCDATSHKSVHFCEAWSEGEPMLPHKDRVHNILPYLRVNEHLWKLNMTRKWPLSF